MALTLCVHVDPGAVVNSDQSFLRLEPGCFSAFIYEGKEAEMWKEALVWGDLSAILPRCSQLYWEYSKTCQFQISVGMCTGAAALPSLGQVVRLSQNVQQHWHV